MVAQSTYRNQGIGKDGERTPRLAQGSTVTNRTPGRNNQTGKPVAQQQTTGTIRGSQAGGKQESQTSSEIRATSAKSAKILKSVSSTKRDDQTPNEGTRDQQKSPIPSKNVVRARSQTLSVNTSPYAQIYAPANRQGNPSGAQTGQTSYPSSPRLNITHARQSNSQGHTLNGQARVVNGRTKWSRPQTNANNTEECKDGLVATNSHSSVPVGSQVGGVDASSQGSTRPKVNGSHTTKQTQGGVGADKQAIYRQRLPRKEPLKQLGANKNVPQHSIEIHEKNAPRERNAVVEESGEPPETSSSGRGQWVPNRQSNTQTRFTGARKNVPRNMNLISNKNAPMERERNAPSKEEEQVDTNSAGQGKWVPISKDATKEAKARTISSQEKDQQSDPKGKGASDSREPRPLSEKLKDGNPGSQGSAVIRPKSQTNGHGIQNQRQPVKQLLQLEPQYQQQSIDSKRRLQQRQQMQQTQKQGRTANAHASEKSVPVRKRMQTQRGGDRSSEQNQEEIIFLDIAEQSDPTQMAQKSDDGGAKKNWWAKRSVKKDKKDTSTTNNPANTKQQELPLIIRQSGDQKSTPPHLFLAASQSLQRYDLSVAMQAYQG